MNRKQTRQAFTLIELLTVMAIIVVLIGILTPALSAARNRATKTAIAAQINAMSVGLDAFRNDEGKYPASNAALWANDPLNPAAEMTAWEVGTPSAPLQGAHILVDALVGRDQLGYDPRSPQVSAGGVIGTSYNRWSDVNDPGGATDRRDPYIPVDGVDVTSPADPPQDGDGVIPGTTQPMIDGNTVPVFRDKFGWPFLYYRASLTANQNTPIIQTSNSNINFGDGVYDGVDNELFTSYAGSNHKINQANIQMDFVTPAEVLPNNFAEFIRSFRASSYDQANDILIDFPRPVKADRFIILSAGKDGIYGNLDDVANFAVLSTER